MAIILTEKQVTELLDIETAIAAVEEVVRDQAVGQATNRPRQRVFGGGSLLHVMAGGDKRLGVYGFKAYSTAKTGARFLVMLYDSASGDLLALIEADRLGQMRTGAASGVATRYMAREDAESVGVFGTGWQAESQLMAVCAVRKIKRVACYSRSPENRRKFAEKMSALINLDVAPVLTPEEAVCGHAILITATSARQAFLQGEWLEPGQHLNVVGANYLSKSEVNAAAVAKARVIAVDSIEQAKMEAGDLLPALENGTINWESVTELGRIVAGQVAGRHSLDDITLFKSGGIAIWDVSTALRVYNLARQRGIGKPLDLWTE
ncbi:MAG TPA: ornithine cyclodeaminase family protein [Blastocatellia bacterium]|nr:ornithine cyclodeaminase family protein [Blastocatellia bacterium]